MILKYIFLFCLWISDKLNASGAIGQINKDFNI